MDPWEAVILYKYRFFCREWFHCGFCRVFNSKILGGLVLLFKYMLNLEDLLLVLHSIILFLQILKIRFCIQANRDVTRMEIFVSLVHLLEQTIKNNAVAPGNGIENGNMMVHQSFHQGTSIPATGQPCGLQ